MIRRNVRLGTIQRREIDPLRRAFYGAFGRMLVLSTNVKESTLLDVTITEVRGIALENEMRGFVSGFCVGLPTDRGRDGVASVQLDDQRAREASGSVSNPSPVR